MEGKWQHLPLSVCGPAAANLTVGSRARRQEKDTQSSFFEVFPQWGEDGETDCIRPSILSVQPTERGLGADQHSGCAVDGKQLLSPTWANFQVSCASEMTKLSGNDYISIRKVYFGAVFSSLGWIFVSGSLWPVTALTKREILYVNFPQKREEKK